MTVRDEQLHLHTMTGQHTHTHTQSAYQHLTVSEKTFYKCHFRSCDLEVKVTQLHILSDSENLVLYDFKTTLSTRKPSIGTQTAGGLLENLPDVTG